MVLGFGSRLCRLTSGWLAQAVQWLRARGWVSEKGLVAIEEESPSPHRLPPLLGALLLWDCIQPLRLHS